MSVAVPFIDALALVACIGALGLLLSIPVTAEGAMNNVAKACLALAAGVYIFAMTSNLLEHANVTAALDPFEDYVEILFPLMVLYGMYALYTRQRERELLASQRVTQRSQEMLLGILDSAPAGILVLDTAGRVTFANDAAKAVLDLTETASCSFTTPGWMARVGDAGPSPDFRDLVSVPSAQNGTTVSVEWPTGWKIDLKVVTEALGDDAGGLGGMVATFLPPEVLRTDEDGS